MNGSFLKHVETGNESVKSSCWIFERQQFTNLPRRSLHLLMKEEQNRRLIRVCNKTMVQSRCLTLHCLDHVKLHLLHRILKYVVGTWGSRVLLQHSMIILQKWNVSHPCSISKLWIVEQLDRGRFLSLYPQFRAKSRNLLASGSCGWLTRQFRRIRPGSKSCARNWNLLQFS